MGIQCTHRRSNRAPSVFRFLSSVVIVGILVQCASGKVHVEFKEGWQGEVRRMTKASGIAKRGPPKEHEGQIPMHITNNCDDTIWPGIANGFLIGASEGIFIYLVMKIFGLFSTLSVYG